jgi:hypothetical protein
MAADLAKTQRTPSNSNENAAKSTKLTIIPSLITVWLQLRVLPGPPKTSGVYQFLAWVTAPETLALLLVATSTA